MQYTTTVRLFIAGDPDQVIPNARVSLYDRDRLTPDDLLGTAVTDEKGEASFRFTSEEFVDLDDKLGGVFPELYAVVHGPDDQVVANLRGETVPNAPLKRIHVALDRELALRHNLIAGGSPGS